MDRERAEAIVKDPYQPRRACVGFYTPTEEFKQHGEHIATDRDRRIVLEVLEDRKKEGQPANRGVKESDPGPTRATRMVP